MWRFYSSILLLLWLDPSVLQVSEEIMKALHALRWLLHRNDVLRHALKEGPSFEMQLQRRKIPFCQDSGAWHDACMDFLFLRFVWIHSKEKYHFKHRRKWFALMFLWIFCKELGLSYFVAQPHGFKRQTWWSGCKLDEVFRDMGESLANATLLSFKRFSCKGIHENVKAWRERIFAGSWIGEGCLRLKEIINNIQSNEWKNVSRETPKNLIWDVSWEACLKQLFLKSEDAGNEGARASAGFSDSHWSFNEI